MEIRRNPSAYKSFKKKLGLAPGFRVIAELIS